MIGVLASVVLVFELIGVFSVAGLARHGKCENPFERNGQTCFGCQLGEIKIMRMFKVTACVPSQSRIRTQRELQNTFFTKLVPYDNWFREQQRIQKMGGRIVKVELATGKPGRNTGLA
jgi:phycobilisome core linker protein